MGFVEKWPSIKTSPISVRVPTKTRAFWRKKWQKEIDDYMDNKLNGNKKEEVKIGQ